VVTDREVLKLRENTCRARTIKVAEEAIEPVVAVQPAALIADLNEPGPDIPASCNADVAPAESAMTSI
jgi:hypothetical protein